MEVFILKYALKKIEEGDNIPDALIISVRDAVLDIFCHGQLNCSKAENLIFKMDLISFDQQSRKEYITNLSKFLIEKKILESPGYLNYFYDKFKTTLSMIYENKGTVAIGIAVIILSLSVIEQHKNMIVLNEKFVSENRNENKIIEEFIYFKENEEKKWDDENNSIVKDLNFYKESRDNLIEYITKNYYPKYPHRLTVSFPKFF